MFNVIGPILGSQGYSIHVRGLANALSKITDVRLTTNLIPGWESQVNDKELEMIKKKVEKDEINLIVAMPNQWRIYTGNNRNWAYLIFEGDKIPESWIDECLNPDIEYILVPSEHVKNAILKTFGEGRNLREYILAKDDELENKIKIIPHGVDHDLFYKKDQEKEKFTFLANKGFRNLEDRGGIQYLIKAYTEEFTDENVKLLIKINPAYGIPDLQKMVVDLAPEKQFPGIEFNIENLDYKELVNLYNKGDVFVSPTRAEAFNIPCLEAMSCGLPVITTSFGGQTDYVNNDNGWIIEGKLEEVKHELLYEGISWLTPDIESLKKRMREAYSKSLEVKNKGKQALEDSKKYSWDKTAELLMML